MARQPIDKALKGKRRPISRQAIWNAIRDDRESFTIVSLSSATRINVRTVRSYVDALVAGKFVSPEPEPHMVPRRYRLVRDIGREAPRLRPNGEPVTQGSAREQMWRTMKIAVQFTATALAAEASLPGSVVSEIDAKDYCKRLAAAGYLAVVVKGHGPRKGQPAIESVFRFVRTRDTGPLPPMIQRLKSVFDPNLNEVVWQEEPRA